MTMKHMVMFVLFLSSCLFANAQVPGGDQLLHMNSGFGLHGYGIVLTADGADVNRITGRIDLRGVVKVRPEVRPLMQEVPTTNRAGVPFPAVAPVVMHFRGKLEVTVGRLVIQADEADVDSRTGETEFRGNVSAIRQ